MISLATAPTRAAADAGAKLWRHRVASPVRRPTEALYGAGEEQLRQLAAVARPALRRLLEAALSASLLEAFTSALVEQAVIERVIDQLLDGETLERLLLIAERRQLAARALDSQLATSAVSLLSQSEDILRLAEALSRSEEVRDALRAQSTGLAAELAVELRGRSGRVDDALERRARALLRRNKRPPPVVNVTRDDFQ